MLTIVDPNLATSYRNGPLYSSPDLDKLIKNCQQSKDHYVLKLDQYADLTKFTQYTDYLNEDDYHWECILENFVDETNEITVSGSLYRIWEK